MNEQPIQACRNRVQSLVNEVAFANPGLALARYLASQDNVDAKRRLLRAAANSSASDAYRRAYARWKYALEARGARIVLADLTGPLAVGLGAESPLEIGLTTHHTYGMPVIPGSAIKGLCLRGADRALEKNGASSKALFGDTDSASYFIFHDAWYDPHSVGGKPFQRDVITVHHRDYYGRKKDAWPTDFDDPVPVPFLSVRPGATFCFALEAPDAAWADFAEKLLCWSIVNLGVGGKTNAGYGRFRAESRVPPESVSGRAGEPAQTAPDQALLVETWSRVNVTRIAGNGEIVAILGAEKAVASGSTAAKLFTALPELARAGLTGKKRQIVADVRVRRLGNQLTIDEIMVEGGAE